jgi:hypothetical protein
VKPLVFPEICGPGIRLNKVVSKERADHSGGGRINAGKGTARVEGEVERNRRTQFFIELLKEQILEKFIEGLLRLEAVNVPHVVMGPLIAGRKAPGIGHVGRIGLILNNVKRVFPMRSFPNCLPWRSLSYSVPTRNKLPAHSEDVSA